MATTATENARDLCTAALRLVGASDTLTPPESEDLTIAVGELNRMLKAWQQIGHCVWKRAGQSVTLVSGQASYSLTGRPLSIESARYKNGGVELFMSPLTRADYDRLPTKTTAGTPTQFYYDRQRENEALKIWPVPSNVTDQTIELTVVNEIEDVTQESIDDAVDVPAEWYAAVVSGLAARLALIYAPARLLALQAMAASDLSACLAFDRDESVFFTDCTYGGY